MNREEYAGKVTGCISPLPVRCREDGCMPGEFRLLAVPTGGPDASVVISPRLSHPRSHPSSVAELSSCAVGAGS